MQRVIFYKKHFIRYNIKKYSFFITTEHFKKVHGISDQKASSTPQSFENSINKIGRATPRKAASTINFSDVLAH